MEAGIYFLFFQIAAIVFLKNLKDRVSIIKTAFGMAIINMLTIIMFLLLYFIQYDLVQAIIHSYYGIVASILSSLLSIVVLHFYLTDLLIFSVLYSYRVMY